MIFIQTKSKAAGTYNPSNPFTYSYQDYPYWFSPESTVDMPENIGIYSDVLDYVIEIGASAQVLQFSSYYPFGFVLGSLSENIANYIFSLVINARIALGKAFSWVLPSNVNCVYAWQIKFLGVQDSYLDYDPNLYGPAYGWRFEGLLGEDIDVVLDQYGDFYGDNVVPHGNYTFTDQSEEIEWISIHQTNPSEDELYIPSYTSYSFNDLEPPCIIGDKLYFTLYINNVPTRLHTRYSFKNTALVITYKDWAGTNTTQPVLCFMSPIVYNTGLSYLLDDNENGVSFQGQTANGNNSIFTYHGTNYTCHLNGLMLRYNVNYSSNFPSHYILEPFRYNNVPTFNYDTVDTLGFLNNSRITGTSVPIFLRSISYTPVSDPVEVPVDVPVPFDDIPSDPTDYDPDPNPTPDPVPGSDYPEPEPSVPAIPPIVSGNDDIWPDVNVMFDLEFDLDGFLGPLLEFDFPDFNTVIDSVLGPLAWISGIMSLLFEGSDFGILFTILAVFFIASAILGIYKWWTN